MIAAWVFLLLQAPPQAPAAPAAASEAAPKVTPYVGTLREGRLELARLSKRNEHAAARDLAQSLLAKDDFERAPELERAEALYAIGLAHGRAGEIPEAVEHFHRARGLAGSGELGRAAAYNSGTFLLQGAESLRQQIPELREKFGLPPLEPDPSAGADAGSQSPDALTVAREAYLVARAELIDALRSERIAEDVRANLELCVRRIRELDAIERQREEQKQDEQNQQDEQQEQKNDEQQSKDSQDPKDSDSKQDPKQDPSKDEQKPEQKPESSKENEPKAGDKPEQSDPKPEESKESEAKPDEAKEPPQLSAEEMQRLLQQLQQIDEKAKQVEAMLRERRRQPVKRDW